MDRSIAGGIIPAEHICDMSSVVSTAATTTTVVHLRKLDGEELPSLTPLQSADCLNGDGEAITIPEVLAETDEEKKADAAIVDTGGDAHVKITGRDCVADYDCDYWYGTGIMDGNMEYRSGDCGGSPDGTEACDHSPRSPTISKTEYAVPAVAAVEEASQASNRRRLS